MRLPNVSPSRRPTDFRGLLVAMAWVALASACGPGGPPDAGFDPDAGACGTLPAAPASCDGGASFRAVQAQVFSGCMGVGVMSCHGKSPFGGGLDLTASKAYPDLVNAAATQAVGKLRVRPADPARSFLLQKLTNTQCPQEGTPMPQGEGIQWRLPPQSELDLVWCWISSGAQNN